MKMKHKFLSMALAAAMTAAMSPAAIVNAETVLYDNATGTEDGLNYELWKDRGDTKMVLTGNGTFSCEWDNINNCLFRIGKKFDCTQTYKEIGNIAFDYEVDYHPDGNSYLCVYGWTRDPLVEYYIVDNWGTWRPPGDEGYVTTMEIDGASYDIYQTDRIGQPSIDGDRTDFKQYWSVRKDKRSSGVINMASHFAAWESLGFPVGKFYEAALNIEGYQSKGYATVLKNQVTVGGEVSPVKPPAEPDKDGYFYHATFESGNDDWGARGDASAASTGKEAFAGNKSLAVTGRTDSWNGVSRPLSTLTFVPGTAYSFSTIAMQNTTASEDFKLTLEYDGSDGEKHYDAVAEATGIKGQWVQLANTSYTIPEGAKNLILYVETKDTTTDFYIDEAVAAPEGIKVTVDIKGIKGDVNTDHTVDLLDIVQLQKYLLKDDVTVDGDASDMNDDGAVDVFDLGLLKRAVLNKQNEPTPPEPPEVPEDKPQRVEGQWYNTADVSWIDPSKPMVAIAFDDGPIANSNCPTRILNTLSENGFHSTFFYWGNRIAGNEAEIKRAHELGMEIANHTWSHPNMTELDANGMRNEINKCADALTQITGETDFLIRPPYLAVNDTFRQTAGVPLVSCGVDSQDWNGATKDQIINTITSKMNDGSLNGQVVLMHENYESTAAAMEYLAPLMKERGWQIVTVSEMFKANGKVMYNGEVYNYVR